MPNFNKSKGYSMQMGSKEINTPSNFKTKDAITIAQSPMAMMGDKPKTKKLSFGKKLLNTIGQGAKDIGTQIIDMLEIDPGHVSGVGSRGTYGRARTIKNWEQSRYDVSRDRAKRGETFGSLARFFDDSGQAGNPFGLGKYAKRGSKGSGSMKAGTYPGGKNPGAFPPNY